MRKAYALTELLMMFAVILVLSFMCTEPVRTVIADMQRSQKDLQTNADLLNMLRSLQNDVEKAVNLSDQPGRMSGSGNVILIETDDRTISYRINDENVVKTIVYTDLGSPPGEEKWHLLGANINWAVWEDDGSGYAVEISTSIDRKSGGKMHHRLKNSHVFFTKTDTKDKR